MCDQYKIAIVGDSGVGKTSFIQRLLGKDFSEKYTTPSPPRCEVHTVKHKERGRTYQFYEWSEYLPADDPVTRGLQYSGLDAAIVMFDHSKVSTFESVRKWIKLVQAIDPDAAITVVGTKVDKHLRPLHSKPGYHTHHCSSVDESREQLLAIMDELCSRA